MQIKMVSDATGLLTVEDKAEAMWFAAAFDLPEYTTVTRDGRFGRKFKRERMIRTGNTYKYEGFLKAAGVLS